MKKIIGAVIVVVFIFAIVIIANNNYKIPDGWYPAGSNPNEYEMGVDNTIFQSGQSCAYKIKKPKEQ